LVQSVINICYIIDWDAEIDKKPLEQKVDINKEQEIVLIVLNQKGKAEPDLLAIDLRLPVSKIMYLLFQHELNDL